jgi:hypothetical protein
MCPAAKGYLRKQHYSCHQAWKFYLQDVSGSEEDSDDPDDSDDTDYNVQIYDLIRDLGTMARRDALNSSLTMEENGASCKTKQSRLEVRTFFSISIDAYL